MYAGDTTLYFNLEDIDSVNLNESINMHLEYINVWLKLNKLTVNISKTKCMIFHKRRDVPQLHLLFDIIQIELVSNFTFLGIILDPSLLWKFYTKMIAIKISNIIGILHKLKYIFLKEIILIIYKSLIMPHLNYSLGHKKQKHYINKWMTRGLLRSINSKNKLYKKLVQTRVAGNGETYNQLEIKFNIFRNILRQSIKDAKLLYFQRIFEKFQHDIKITWSTINEKLQRKKKKISCNIFYHDGKILK